MPIIPAHDYAAPEVADMDADGESEIVLGASVVIADGTVRWTGWDGTGNGIAFPVDLTGDGQMAVVAGDTVYSNKGAVLWTMNMSESMPAVADMDGDGLPEIGIAGGHGYTVFKHDLSILWQQTTVDASSGHTGSSVFDFEGDGAAEVV